MTNKQFAALLGFAFIATWGSLGLITAVLCLFVALLSYVAVGIRGGEIDLAEIQDRLSR